MLGQVATFMESLHLSYNEVVNVLPYRCLLVMQRDKLHVVTGELVKEVDEAEFFAMKGMGNPLVGSGNE